MKGLQEAPNLGAVGDGENSQTSPEEATALTPAQTQLQRGLSSQMGPGPAPWPSPSLDSIQLQLPSQPRRGEAGQTWTGCPPFISEQD